MKSLRTLLALLLAALWPLATSHCKLEQLPGLEFLACATEASVAAHQQNDCKTDSCAFIESGFYKIEDAGQMVPTPPDSPAQLTVIALAARPPTTARAVFDSTPPELSRVWQFSLRTALSPRAPSFVS